VLIALTQITLKSYQYITSSNLERSLVVDADRHLHLLLPGKLTSLSVPGTASAPKIANAHVQEIFEAAGTGSDNVVEVFQVSYYHGTSSERNGVLFVCPQTNTSILMQSPVCSLVLTGPPQPDQSPSQNPTEVKIQLKADPIHTAYGGKPYLLTDWLGD
jgi:hypothetical protein